MVSGGGGGSRRIDGELLMTLPYTQTSIIHGLYGDVVAVPLEPVLAFGT